MIQHGRRYRLGDAVQYVSGDGAEVVVIAWKHGTSLRLSGLDTTARYRNRRTSADWFGAALVRDGLPLELPEGDYPSVAIHLVRV